MKIKKRNLTLFLLLAPFFKPEYVNRIPIISSLFDIAKVIAVLYCLLLYASKKDKREDKESIVLIIFSFFLLFMTIIQGGDLFACFKFVAPILSITILFKSFRDKPYDFIDILLRCFEIVIYANFVSILLYPQGMYSTGSIYTGVAKENWILGFKNTQVVYFLPALVLSNLLLYKYEQKVRHYILVAAVFFSTVIIGSTTTLLGLIMYAIIVLCLKLKSFNKVITIKSAVIVVGIFVAMILLQRLNLFVEAARYLGKDSTFLNRTYIWNRTLNAISGNLILGHGWQSEAVRNAMYGSSSIVHAHNMVLEELYLGGVLLIGIKLIMYRMASKKVKQLQNRKIANCLIAGIFTWFVLGLTEFYSNPLLYIVIILALFSNQIDVDKTN